MKNNKLVLSILILFMFISYTVLTRTLLEHDDNTLDLQDITENKNFTEKKPKSSKFWDLTGTPIFINNSDTGNTDWATINSTYDWCNGAGTWSDPYILENITIDCQGTSSGIKIYNSDVPFIIQNCTIFAANFLDGHGSILYKNVNNSVIIGNNISNNDGAGIFLDYPYSYNNTIQNNIFNDNQIEGIRIGGGNDNRIYYNNLSRNSYGILAYGSNNNISYNRINESGNWALKIHGSYMNITENILRNNNGGMRISCNDSDIWNNSVSGCYDTVWGMALSLYSAENNEIFKNNFTDNKRGINIENSNGNKIYLNNISNSEISTVYEASGLSNQWDNGSIGNYWDDYGGKDQDNDGIGDTSYSISPSGNVDRYPIWDDGPEPPGAFSASSTADNPDPDGTFNLIWDFALGAENYSIYMSESFISVITLALTLVAKEIDINSHLIQGYNDGEYYFIIVAHNNIGNTTSNCIKIIVGEETVGEETSNGISFGLYHLIFILIAGAALIFSIKNKKLLIKD